MEEIARLGEQTIVSSGERSPNHSSHSSYTNFLYGVFQNPIGFVS